MSVVGADDLRLPDSIREGVLQHLQDLREAYEKRGWGGRVGFGERPAVIVIDYAKGWTDPDKRVYGSNLDEAVIKTVSVLEAAREAEIPIFFTVMSYGPDDVKCPVDSKMPGLQTALADGSEAVQLDSRLGRLPTEKLIVKKHASSFKGTNLHEMLSALKVDTLIVTGCSTSHCVYETCDDAATAFHVIVPEGTVGDRCEIFHLLELMDIDLTLGDVVALEEVVSYIRGVGLKRRASKES